MIRVAAQRTDAAILNFVMKMGCRIDRAIHQLVADPMNLLAIRGYGPNFDSTVSVFLAADPFPASIWKNNKLGEQSGKRIGG